MPDTLPSCNSLARPIIRSQKPSRRARTDTQPPDTDPFQLANIVKSPVQKNIHQCVDSIHQTPDRRPVYRPRHENAVGPGFPESIAAQNRGLQPVFLTADIQPVNARSGIDDEIQIQFPLQSGKRPDLFDLQLERTQRPVRQPVLDIETDSAFQTQPARVFPDLFRIVAVSPLDIDRNRNIDPGRHLPDDMQQIPERNRLSVGITESIGEPRT